VQPQRPTAPSLERGEIAERLRGDEGAERLVPAGNRQVLRRLGGDLEEDSRVRPALVKLAGRVQEPRAESEGRRRAGAPADALPDALQALLPAAFRSNTMMGMSFSRQSAMAEVSITLSWRLMTSV
jgi:hypothetical protein